MRTATNSSFAAVSTRLLGGAVPRLSFDVFRHVDQRLARADIGAVRVVDELSDDHLEPGLVFGPGSFAIGREGEGERSCAGLTIH